MTKTCGGTCRSPQSWCVSCIGSCFMAVLTWVGVVICQAYFHWGHQHGGPDLECVVNTKRCAFVRKPRWTNVVHYSEGCGMSETEGGGGIGRQVAVMGWPCRDNISQDDIDQLKNAMTTHAENTKRDQPVLCKEP